MNFKKSWLLGIGATLLLSSCNTTGNFINPNPVTVFPNFNSYATNANVKNLSVEIQWNQKSDLTLLENEGFDLYGFNRNSKTVKARISENQKNVLKSKGLGVKDIRETSMAEGNGLLPGYRTYQQMKDYLFALQNQYPDLVTVKDVGDTWQKVHQNAKNNDEWMIAITNKKSKAKNKPTALFIAGLHARELAPVEIILKFADELVTKYGKDDYITSLLDTREIHLVPMVNVDGRIMVQNGNTWQRENANGVDLNRNYDCKYLPGFTPKGTDNQEPQEPETIAVQDLYKVTKYTLFMDIHSYGEMFFWPVGYSEKDIPEAAPFKRVYANTFKKIGYEGGTSAQILYSTVATSDDYAYIKQHAFGLGMEVGQSFRPSYAEVEKMWTAIKPNFLYLFKISDAPFNQ